MSLNRRDAARTERRGPRRARLRAGVHVVRVAIVAIVLVPRLADAHAVGISRGEYELHGNTVSASLVFARPEIATVVPSIDANHDGTVSDVELQKARHEIE